MIKLRKLMKKDAPLMLEWMHDTSIVSNLQTNFASKTLADCEKFINMAQNTKENMHLALTDDNDTYMGTVSLKHITSESAEFAITVRKTAMGQGYSQAAMQEIIRIGLADLGLKRIYWCVAPENIRAIRFYDKNGYKRISLPDNIQPKGYTVEQQRHYLWYGVEKQL